MQVRQPLPGVNSAIDSAMEMPITIGCGRDLHIELFRGRRPLLFRRTLPGPDGLHIVDVQVYKVGKIVYPATLWAQAAPLRYACGAKNIGLIIP